MTRPRHYTPERLAAFAASHTELVATLARFVHLAERGDREVFGQQHIDEGWLAIRNARKAVQP
jgi:hypothetical protein